MLPTKNLDYEKLYTGLDDADKKILRQILEEKIRAQKEIIEENIRSDKEHLDLVNFCIDPFKYKSFLDKETGYLFIRVEPFFGLRTKDFDIAIYNADSKVLILVECKSSLYDEQKEVHDLLETIDVAKRNRELLEEIVGDKIAVIEYSLCCKPGLALKMAPIIASKPAPICVWSADIYGDTLSLAKPQGDTDILVRDGKLHRDGRLRQLLLNGAKSVNGPTRLMSFLPSSHPCTILEEICALLGLSIKRSERERFRLSDVQNVIQQEECLSNFSLKELWDFTNRIFQEGTKVGIFNDLTPNIPEVSDKEFELGVAHTFARSSVGGVKKRYLDFHAKDKAEENAVEEFTNRKAKGFTTLNHY